jgi:hypothetical protein
MVDNYGHELSWYQCRHTIGAHILKVTEEKKIRCISTAAIEKNDGHGGSIENIENEYVPRMIELLQEEEV